MCLFPVLLQRTVGYHGNEINKPLHSKGHPPVVTHTLSHHLLNVLLQIANKLGLLKKNVGGYHSRQK
jgi:hypothetical protein